MKCTELVKQRDIPGRCQGSSEVSKKSFYSCTFRNTDLSDHGDIYTMPRAAISFISTFKHLGYIPPERTVPAQFANGYPISTGPPGGWTMDVFLGPFCEDSKQMYPTLIALAEEHRGVIGIRLHIFPLPYNIGSFLAGQSCVAGRILSNHTGTAVDCLRVLYQGDNQRNLKSQALGNATTPMQIEALVDLLAVPLGVDAAAMLSQLQQVRLQMTPSIKI